MLLDDSCAEKRFDDILRENNHLFTLTAIKAGGIIFLYRLKKRTNQKWNRMEELVQIKYGNMEE